jgi:hypothetical protein
MKTINKLALVLSTLSLCTLFLASCEKKSDDLILSGDCAVVALRLDTIDGVIDNTTKSVSFTLPKNYDPSAMTVTRLAVSDGATCDISEGMVLNMRSARTIRVTNNDALQLWTICAEYVVERVENPKALYMGIESSFQQLNIEEQTACQWMLDHIEGSTYASIADIANGKINLSECRVIWWHLHKDGGIDGRTAFESHAADILNAIARLKGYYRAGGSFLLTRYATYLPAYLGESECFPNNCWGGVEQNAELINDPWSFFATGHTDHPLWQNLVMNEGEDDRIYTCDAGYRITNSTAQYHIGTDWGGYADYAVWRSTTGAKDIAYGGDGAIVAWEYASTAEHGAILCIGSGCYDWYSTASAAEHYHPNIATITSNAINYLMEK